MSSPLSIAVFDYCPGKGGGTPTPPGPSPIPLGGPRPLIAVVQGSQGFDYWRGNRPVVNPSASVQFDNWLGNRPLITDPTLNNPGSSTDLLSNWLGNRPLIMPAPSGGMDNWFPDAVAYVDQPVSTKASQAYAFTKYIGTNPKLANQNGAASSVNLIAGLGGGLMRDGAPVSSGTYTSAYITAINNLWSVDAIKSILVTDPRDGWSDVSAGGATDIVSIFNGYAFNPAGILIEGPNETDINAGVTYKTQTGITGSVLLMRDLWCNTRRAGGRATTSATQFYNSAANIPTIAALTAQIAFKATFRVDALLGLSAGNNVSIFEVGQSGSNLKIEVYFRQTSSTNFTIHCAVGGTDVSALTTASTLNTVLPASGSDVTLYVSYDNTTPSYTLTLFDAAGDVLVTVTTATGLTALATTGGVNGVVTLGKGHNNSVVPAWNFVNGFAVYTGVAVSAGLQSFPPKAADPNLLAYWAFNDANSGTASTAAATVGGQALTVNSGSITWAGDNLLWPVVPLIAPSIAQPGNGSTDFNNALATLGYGVADVSTHFNMHFYQGGSTPLHNLVQTWITDMNIITGAANMPTYVTETGYNTNGATGEASQPGVSRFAQAKYLLRLMVDLYTLYTAVPGGLDFLGVTLYNMNPSDGPVSASNSWPADMGSWSIVDQSSNPLIAYTALQNLLAIVADPSGSAYSPGTFSYGIAPAPTQVAPVQLVQLLLERSDGTFFLILQQEGDSVLSFDTTNQIDLTVPNVSAQLTFASKPSAIKLYTPLAGTVGSVVAAATTIVVSVPDHPIILQITP